jgi:hypothetical protein
MKRIFFAAAIAGFAAVPAVAQDAKAAQDMTCADLMAMDEAGQMEAMSQLEMAAAEAKGTEMSKDEAMTSGGQMMPGTITACEGNPEMNALEAMQSGM